MTAFDFAHFTCGIALAVLFAVVFFGWVTYFNGQISGNSWALHALNLGRRAQTKALEEHDAVCAQCAYPVQDAEQCPECGMRYDKPNAVMRRELQPQPLPGVPRWLTVSTVLFAGVFTAWHLGPLGFMLGLKMGGSVAKELLGFVGLVAPVLPAASYATWRYYRTS
ncbi:MAG: hypothetical protein ACIAQU_10320 [Phycisphaerales bacterium JB064]